MENWSIIQTRRIRRRQRRLERCTRMLARIRRQYSSVAYQLREVYQARDMSASCKKRWENAMKEERRWHAKLQRAEAIHNRATALVTLRHLPFRVPYPDVTQQLSPAPEPRPCRQSKREDVSSAYAGFGGFGEDANAGFSIDYL